MVECEAILLGREAVHGTANASALATLVKNLSRKCSEFHRRYILRCSKENGVQMIPFRRADDEGFESDEDLTSLGSFDDTSSSSMYVVDHALKVKASQQRSSSSQFGSSSTDATSTTTSVSISSFGTDSANSSGASDNDDAEIHLGLGDNNHRNNKKKQEPDECNSAATETYLFNEIAFCHTDPSLPRIIVWVVKTKRKSSKPSSNEYSYGLDAIVFACKTEEKFKALCKHFQELSRRLKLDKPIKHSTRFKESSPFSLHISESNKTQPQTETINHLKASCSTSCLVTSSQLKNNFAEKYTVVPKFDKEDAKEIGFNLIQRVDTDGVTHIEVTRTSAENRYFPTSVVSDSHEPSSIISINTPELGNIRSIPKVSEKQIESVILTDVDFPDGNSSKDGLAPERPERKKTAKKNKAPAPPPTSMASAAPISEQVKRQSECGNREKVVKGQFVRVSVDQKTLSSSPVTSMSNSTRSGGWLFGSEAKPCRNNVLSSYQGNTIAWNYNNNGRGTIETTRGGGIETVRRGHRSLQAPSADRNDYRRSKSNIHVRKYESPSRAHYPMSHRYIDAFPASNNNSLPNRFFGKLKELTMGSNHSSNSGPRFRRRNSIGDLANSQFYQYMESPTLPRPNRQLTKSTPNLKSVIKNKNGKYQKEDNNEPKKVTFSAYATVQVVD